MYMHFECEIYVKLNNFFLTYFVWEVFEKGSLNPVAIVTAHNSEYIIYSYLYNKQNEMDKQAI